MKLVFRKYEMFQEHFSKDSCKSHTTQKLPSSVVLQKGTIGRSEITGWLWPKGSIFLTSQLVEEEPQDGLSHSLYMSQQVDSCNPCKGGPHVYQARGISSENFLKGDFK